MGTTVGFRVRYARARRARLRRMGPHYRAAVGGRPPRVPYEEIAVLVIGAVERSEFPVQVTARMLGVDKLWLERRLWHVRQVGWLPKGPSPRSGEDAERWLAAAHRLLLERRTERTALLERSQLRARLVKDREVSAARDRRGLQRALKPSGLVLDRFALL